MKMQHRLLSCTAVLCGPVEMMLLPMLEVAGALCFLYAVLLTVVTRTVYILALHGSVCCTVQCTLLCCCAALLLCGGW